MLGGAFVAGTLSAIIAVGSMLELDRASDEFGRAADQSAPNYALAEPEPTPMLRKDYKLSDKASVSERGRTGYLVSDNGQPASEDVQEDRRVIGLCNLSGVTQAKTG